MNIIEDFFFSRINVFDVYFIAGSENVVTDECILFVCSLELQDCTVRKKCYINGDEPSPWALLLCSTLIPVLLIQHNKQTSNEYKSPMISGALSEK